MGGGKEPHEGEGAVESGACVCGAEAEVWVCESALPWDREEREPAVCDVCAGELVSGTEETAGDDDGVVCPETAASLPPSRCGGSLYLLSCIKPLDAFTSGAERLQSELVQTFLRTLPSFSVPLLLEP